MFLKPCVRLKKLSNQPISFSCAFPNACLTTRLIGIKLRGTTLTLAYYSKNGVPIKDFYIIWEIGAWNFGSQLTMESVGQFYSTPVTLNAKCASLFAQFPCLREDRFFQHLDEKWLKSVGIRRSWWDFFKKKLIRFFFFLKERDDSPSIYLIVGLWEVSTKMQHFIFNRQ